MGAAKYVGRVGGLAVALGIGAAVVSGYGVAWAAPDGQSGADSSSSPSSPDSSSHLSTPGAAGKTSAATSSPAQTAAAGSPGLPGGNTGTTTGASTSNVEIPSRTELPTNLMSGSSLTRLPTSTPRRNGSKVSAPPESFRPERIAPSTKGPIAATDTRSTDTDASSQTSEIPHFDADAAEVPTVAVATAIQPTGVTQQRAGAAVDASPAASTANAPRTSADVVMGTLSTLLSSIVSPLANDAPAAPTDSPAMWTLLAAARQETFGAAPAVESAADPVTNGLVVSTPQTPPLAWLQDVPVLGPLFVTPIVAAIHQVPVVSDLLHPLIGYPLQTGLPAGSVAPRDVKVTSFDGAQIYVHFMPAQGLLAGQQAPTLLYGPGIGMPGATNIDGTILDGILLDNVGMMSINTLREAGYNVVTWDPRGEFSSGGVLQLDDPDFEARDVSTIISWVAQQPEAQLNSAGDPRLGMVGVSYGGGIQLTAAAIDHRIDAIVPTIAWNTLNTALYKNNSFKSSWANILVNSLQQNGARINPRIVPATDFGTLTGMLSESDQDLLAQRGPGGVRGMPDLVSQITAPTLLIQGTVDTIFTLQEADANAKTLIAQGVPTKVLWFCGGHGLCVNNLFDTRDGTLIQMRTLEWLDRYVKGNQTTSTGPQFEYVDQRGQFFASDTYPVATGDPIVLSSSKPGVLPLSRYGGSGPLLGDTLPVGATKAAVALNYTLPPATSTTYIVGAPILTLNYSGIGLATHVYAQLVDDSTGLVLGNQATPIPVTLDGLNRTVTIPLESVVQTLRPGQTVTLQLVGWESDYAPPWWSVGLLNVSSMQLSLPTAKNFVLE